jgi:ABC-2 type transport system ATP-binding protein
MPGIIECKNLVKHYGNIRALNDLTFTITEKTSTGLVGPNGAGKSTLLSILCGFTLPSAGNVKILDQTPGSSMLTGRIGMLPQDVSMFSGIAIEKQLVFFARLQGLDKESARVEAERVISKTGTQSLVKQYPETLSHGQRKKVILAQALIGKPDILLLDEPTSGLDPVAASEVRQIIQDLRQQHTLIVSSHNLEEIRNVCNEIIVIDEGSVIRHCPIRKLLEQQNSLNFQLNAPVSKPLMEAIGDIPGVESVQRERIDNTRLAVVCRIDSPGSLQFTVIDCIREHGATVLEFRSGGDFSDRIIQLVSGENSTLKTTN